jgi:hypothetical protein
MNDILFSFLVVLGFFVIIIGLYRWNSGIYPASKLIITPPPITHSGLEHKQAKFMFFHTTWCHHCKNAETPWKSFQQQLKNKPVTYGDYTVIFEDINAESNSGKALLYKIEAYPTFKVETIEKVIEMKGVPDTLTFDAFLTTALGSKKFIS